VRHTVSAPHQSGNRTATAPGLDGERAGRLLCVLFRKPDCAFYLTFSFDSALPPGAAQQVGHARSASSVHYHLPLYHSRLTHFITSSCPCSLNLTSYSYQDSEPAGP